MRAEAGAARVIVDLDALARNYAKLRAAARPAECAAVVKADAYGLGVAPVAQRLAAEGCTRFFVATVAEGVELRALLAGEDIYVFEGAYPESAAALAHARLTPVLNSLEQVKCWAATGGPAALHLDTGMARLGLSARDVRALAEDRALLGALDLKLLITHFACVDEPEHPLNRAQLERFDTLRRLLPPTPTSIGNSAGAVLGGVHCGDVVRPGIGLYGGNPFVDRPNPLEAVATFQARILQVREIEEGGTVGYGATYAVSPPAKLAVVGAGYADGYLRALGNRGVARLAGVRVPVVGRVSMDLTCIDVTNVPADRARAGEWVELFGAAVPIDEVAAAAGTISYELLTRLGPRVRREYRGRAQTA